MEEQNENVDTGELLERLIDLGRHYTNNTLFKQEGYIIAYIDILGYENMLTTDKDITILTLSIYKCIEELKREIKQQNSRRTDEIKYKVFSDNIIICTKIENDCSSVLFILVQLQNYLISHGIFVRGSLSYGNLYFCEEFICGRGIVQAHKLENEIAIYPRIIVDKTFFEVYYPLDRYLFRHDFDGQRFMSYLAGFSFGENATRLSHKAITNHKNEVEYNIKKYKNNIRILQKYEWCKNYHNSFCKEKEHEDYMID